MVIMVRSAFTPFTLLFYKVDKEVFVEYLCINSEQPELHCEGSCQLKKIGDFYEHQHEEKETKVFTLQTFWIVDELMTYDFELFIFNPIHSDFSYSELYQSLHQPNDFKPPIV